jgi:hypothetical protein
MRIDDEFNVTYNLMEDSNTNRPSITFILYEYSCFFLFESKKENKFFNSLLLQYSLQSN